MELEWEKKSYVVFYPGNKESIKTVGKYFISPLLALGSQSLHQPETNTGSFEKIVSEISPRPPCPAHRIQPSSVKATLCRMQCTAGISQPKQVRRGLGRKTPRGSVLLGL